MPQMAPMSWLTLYFLFSFIFLIMNIMNYYSFLYIPKLKLELKVNKNYTNWKW
uniref:ATP synthase F0 subunit 8 n=1 Tax=Curculio bimaculatus TaxID=1150200 RepID=UPI00286AEAB9|nr:ATP synthase F0 subunit 8 [Curculio bimaculatus]WKW54871.1 ATP synthase F0 subunit 8 [Curculio bimaculatus]